MIQASRASASTEPHREGAVASHLARALGKPADDWTVDDLVAFAAEQSVPLVSLMHVGGDGWLKVLDFAPVDAAHLRDILRAGERVDGSSLFGGMGIPTRASDIILRPKLHTAFLDPFAPRPTLAFICEHEGRDGGPLPESPDTIVRRAWRRAKEVAGVDLMALAEVEYFLGRQAQDGDLRSRADGGYHATAPFVFGEELRREAIALLAGMGVPVKYAHSEVGHIEPEAEANMVWEQHEIELRLQPLPQAADSAALTAWVLRRLARARGFHCNLDPVVRAGHAGSGMHVHLSPTREGAHLSTIDDAGRLEPEARWLVGGLARAGGALMAFGNRHPQSFVRLSQGLEAPNTVTWGQYDRRALIRLPAVARDRAGRAVTPPTVELRLPDGSAHAHLLLAGIAQAFVAARSASDLDALIDATRADGAAQERALPVPRSFPEVAAALREQAELFTAGGVFPPHVIGRVCERLGDARP